MGSIITRKVKFESEVSENVPTEEEWERRERAHRRDTEKNKIAGAGVHVQKGNRRRAPSCPRDTLDSWSFESGLPGHSYPLVGCSWLSVS